MRKLRSSHVAGTGSPEAAHVFGRDGFTIHLPSIAGTYAAAMSALDRLAAENSIAVHVDEVLAQRQVLA